MNTSGTDPYLSASQPLTVKVPIKPCPPGFSLTKSDCCDCNKILNDSQVDCNITGKYITRTSPNWIGFSNKSDKVISPGIIYHEHCPFDYCNDINVRIYVSNETINQDSQCAPNRTGLLCSKCSEGLSLSMGTSDCLECTTNVGIALTIIGYGLLGIVLVLILTTFNITITDGTLSGLLFYANTIELYKSIFLPSGNHNILTVIVSSMNLHLGIKTCLFNGMNAYYKAWMGLCFPVYLFAIITGIIALCRVSTKISNLLGGNIIKVLATLIQLFYANLILRVVQVLSFTEVQYPSAITENKSVLVLVWLSDPNLEYFQGKHIPLALVAIVLGVLILAYTLVLLFIQPLQRYSHLRCFTWVAKLKPLIDAYTAPHIIKDNCRYWEGLLLLCRLALSVNMAANIKGRVGNNLNAITIVCTLLITIIWATGGIYKKCYLNILNFLSIVNLGVTSAILSSNAHIKIYQRKQLSTKTLFKITVYTSFTLASVILLGVLLYHIYRRVLLWHLKYKRLHYQALPADTVEDLPAISQLPNENN